MFVTAVKELLDSVHATEERLIAPQYLMQIFAHLALSCTKCKMFAL